MFIENNKRRFVYRCFLHSFTQLNVRLIISTLSTKEIDVK
jgi:hypothetical protein